MRVFVRGPDLIQALERAHKRVCDVQQLNYQIDQLSQDCDWIKDDIARLRADYYEENNWDNLPTYSTRMSAIDQAIRKAKAAATVKISKHAYL